MNGKTQFHVSLTKLIVPISSGDFQISLIYQFWALVSSTVKISSRVDGPAESQVAQDYLYLERPVMGSR